ncbi:MAG: class I SAM-dependent methyltransferase [Patescibacteria group bacterium]|nr:class I SAM-dependent methyltransferase [Patescibacteria group bacterium]
MISRNKIDKIHSEVPPHYYEKSIKKNRYQRWWHNKRFKLILDMIPKNFKGKRYLDVGCNGCLFMEKVAKKMGNVEAYGVDISKPSIEYAKKKYPHFKTQVADCHNLPYKNNFFDFITCFEVIEHVINPKKVIGEMQRCLKKEGELIILVPNENLLFEIIWFFWTKLGRGKVWNNTHVNQIKMTNLEEILQNKGFEIIKTVESHFSLLKAVKAKLVDNNL